MSAEIQRLRQKLAQAEQKRQLVVRQEKEASEQKARQEKAREKRIKAENEARLKATGVVDIFEEIRDSGIVTMSDEPVFKSVYGYENIITALFPSIYPREIKVSDYAPAKIKVFSNGSGVDLLFDWREHKTGSTDHSTNGWNYHDRFSEISAQIEKNGNLTISGEDSFGKRRSHVSLANPSRETVFPVIEKALEIVLGLVPPEQE